MIQIVFLTVIDPEKLSVAAAPMGGHGNFPLPGQVLSRQAFRRVDDILQTPLCDDLAAVNAGVGTDIHNVVRGANGVFVVLHHNQGVAQIPQVAQRFQQTVVIPLVQTDAWFVQNIQYAHQR